MPTDSFSRRRLSLKLRRYPPLLAGMSIAALAALGVQPSFAATPPSPPTAYASYYVQNTSASAQYNPGCDAGHRAADYNRNAEVVLGFGAQTSDNTGTTLIPPANAYISYTDIKSLGEQFSYGFYSCTGSNTTVQLRLGIGTNNSNPSSVNGTAGSTWARVVNDINSWNQANYPARQVIVAAADDIEPAWSSANAARAWLDSYAAATSLANINYGSTDGCPTGCPNGWTTADIYYVSWGEAVAYTAPEIYYNASATEWQGISLYGATNNGARIYFDGPMDEYYADSSTLTPAGAWNALWNALNSDTRTAMTPEYLLNLHYQGS